MDRGVLAASGDVGGARSLIPVLEELCKEKLMVQVIAHGYISKYLQQIKSDFLAVIPDGIDAVDKLIKNEKLGVYLFTASVKDIYALSLARKIKDRGIPVICLLDNPVRYKERLEIDGLPTFSPDIYALPSKDAYLDALQYDFSEDSLHVTGQPALASLELEWSSFQDNKREWDMRDNRWYDSRKLIVFLSEPVEMDQGNAESSRGYTEKTVVPVLCNALQKYSDYIQIGVLPHPREDAKGLLALFEEHCGRLHWGHLKNCTGRESVFLADGICGMAAILLYEAWLIGKPVLSLQPGISRDDYLYITKKKGVCSVTQTVIPEEIVNVWFEEVRNGVVNPSGSEELKIHNNAVNAVRNIIKNYL